EVRRILRTSETIGAKSAGEQERVLAEIDAAGRALDRDRRSRRALTDRRMELEVREQELLLAQIAAALEKLGETLDEKADGLRLEEPLPLAREVQRAADALSRIEAARDERLQEFEPERRQMADALEKYAAALRARREFLMRQAQDATGRGRRLREEGGEVEAK